MGSSMSPILANLKIGNIRETEWYTYVDDIVVQIHEYCVE